MAIIRKNMSTHGDDGAGNPLVVFWVEYDNVALRLTAAGCVNNSNLTAYAEATRLDGSRKQSALFLGQTNTSAVIPTGAAQRLNITITSKGGIDGIDFRTVWPWEG